MSDNINLITAYGGELKNLIVDEERASELKEASKEWESWDLSPRQECDLELLLNGGFSPLEGFLNKADYENVVENMELADGTLWPIPIQLDVTEDLAQKLSEGGSLALRDAEGVMIAVIHIENIWRPDKTAEAEKVYGTTDLYHKGVAHLLERSHDWYVGGKIEGFQLPQHYDNRGMRHTPAELREEFTKAGWRKIVAFQTRNPMHQVPQVYVTNSRVLNLDPKDPLWVGKKKPSEDHPTGITHRDTLKMDWSHGHNSTIHNGISRIGFYTGGKAARFRDEDLADEWVKQSRKWIKENKDDPFFLFFASHDIHVPRIPHERFQGSTRLGYRGDCIVQLDWCVGELMKTLDEEGIAENTLVVFCSDNGPVMNDGYADQALEKLGDHRAGGPFTGGKYSIYEGGTRTPFITRWKGTIAPGGTSDKVVCTIDLAASLASQAGVKIPEQGALDSLNVMDALLGKKDAKGRDHLVQQGNRANNLSLRAGNWKLLHHKGTGRNLVVEKKLASTKVPEFQLIDLAKDPAEKNNVIAEFPDKAKELQKQLVKIVADGRTRPVE